VCELARVYISGGSVVVVVVVVSFLGVGIRHLNSNKSFPFLFIYLFIYRRITKPHTKMALFDLFRDFIGRTRVGGRFEKMNVDARIFVVGFFENCFKTEKIKEK
jgi:hypothetical protein